MSTVRIVMGQATWMSHAMRVVVVDVAMMGHHVHIAGAWGRSPSNARRAMAAGRSGSRRRKHRRRFRSAVLWTTL
jgi:hypothetical protein